MRPSKFTDQIIQKLKEAFKLWCTVEEACSYAEISKSSYYEWLSINKEFSDEIKIAKKYLEFKSRAVIARSLEEWNVKTAMWYLERKNKKEFNINFIENQNIDKTNNKMIIEYIEAEHSNYDQDWNLIK